MCFLEALRATIEADRDVLVFIFDFKGFTLWPEILPDDLFEMTIPTKLAIMLSFGCDVAFTQQTF